MPEGRMRRVAFAVVTVAVASALGLATGEIGVRLLGLDASVRAHFLPGIYRADPELGWGLLPGYSGLWLEDERRTPVSTNSLGFRAPEWDSARAGAALRVLALGDSCAFGLGVGDDETVASELERVLRERGRDAAVFNAGVPGYDSVQEAALLERLAPLLQPHAVIVLWLSNDLAPETVAERVQVIDGQLVEDVERYRAWRDRVDQRGIYASALYRVARVRWRLALDRLGRGRRELGEIPPEHFRRSFDALAAIQARSEALGARSVLLPLPRREQVEGTAPDGDLNHVADFARAHGMEVVLPQAGWSALDGRRLYLNDNVHLNASGYREVARALADSAALGASR